MSAQKFQILVFILATHYDGNEPDDATEFLNSLNANKYDEFFEDKKVVIYGLGDSNYTLFNKFAKDVHQKLLSVKSSVFFEKSC